MNIEDINSYIRENSRDFILYRAQELFEESACNPVKRSDALQTVAQLISYKKEASMRAFYVEQIYKDFKINKKLLTDEITSILKYQGPNVPVYVPFENQVPKEALEDFREFGFYEQGNCYMFLNKDGNAIAQSNFVINPLYHLYSKTDNKRLIEIVNVYGIKKITDILSRCFVSVEMFQQSIIDEGNYLFSGSKFHFFKILGKIMSKFSVASELKTLGWQREGFYAFANGIFSDVWKPVDSFGIVAHKDKMYFSPSFSSIYADVRQDDDEYENDRYIVFKKSPVDFKTWCTLMFKVYGTNARIAVAFIIAALFRDCIYDKYKMFPLLFLFGEKQSGKSQLAWSLSNLCNYSLPPFNLNSGTQVGFFRRLARVNNGIAWYDEYTTNIDEKRHQALKSAYDGVGHEKGKMTKDNRTEITKVASAVIISGQYLPTKDDNALFTRSILLSFEKKIYSDEEMAHFNKLKSFEEDGITGLMTEILPFRLLIDKKYGVQFSAVFDKMKAELQSDKKEFEERLLRNFVSILTPFKILAEGGMIFGDDFLYTDLYSQCIKMIPQLSAQISSSEALSTFWNMIEFLFEEGKISNNFEFRLENSPLEGTIVHKLGTKDTIRFDTPIQLLFIRFSKIHPLYLEYHRKQHGTNGVDMVSLKHYIYHHPAFIGQQDSHRFYNTVSSCYVFNYSILKINLERVTEGMESIIPTGTIIEGENPKDDLPF